MFYLFLSEWVLTWVLSFCLFACIRLVAVLSCIGIRLFFRRFVTEQKRSAAYLCSRYACTASYMGDYLLFGSISDGLGKRIENPVFGQRSS